MGTLDEASLTEKLSKLNQSQASIQTLSEWCVFYRQDSAAVVKVWSKEFHKASPSSQMAFVYLANDILQKSRKKGPEFVNDFFRVLPKALRALAGADQALRSKIQRLIGVWEERKVFGSHNASLNVLRSALDGAPDPAQSPKSPGGGKARFTPEATVLAQAITKVKMAQPANDALLARCEAVARGDGADGDDVNVHALMQEYISRTAADVQRRESLISLLRHEIEGQELELQLSRDKLAALQGGGEEGGEEQQQGRGDNSAAEVAERLAATEASAAVLAQALAELPAEERDQFGRGVVQAISSQPESQPTKRARA